MKNTAILFTFISVLTLLAGCSRYADFTLPAEHGGDSHLTFDLRALPEPVLTRGNGWESGDVLNPSVVRENGGLVNYYSGFDGHTWHTGRATSPDGIHWQKTGRLQSPNPATWEGSYIAANGAAYDWQGRVLYWYVAGPRTHPQIGLDGRVVLPTGPYMSWDEIGASDPYVIRIEPYFYLYYTGLDRGSRQRLGVARSTDGIRWEKLRSNPILEPGGPGSFDANGLGEPAVWQSHGFYWMLFTGRDAAENRRLGLARSLDGVHWNKLPTVFQGSQDWDSKVICDPTVLVDGDIIRVWFGGGDMASPDENLHGQIGYATLQPVSATLQK
jgi:Glycosyl hydrolases family 32 N-terminal domain